MHAKFCNLWVLYSWPDIGPLFVNQLLSFFCKFSFLTLFLEKPFKKTTWTNKGQGSSWNFRATISLEKLSYPWEGMVSRESKIVSTWFLNAPIPSRWNISKKRKLLIVDKRVITTSNYKYQNFHNIIIKNFILEIIGS